MGVKDVGSLDELLRRDREALRNKRTPSYQVASGPHWHPFHQVCCLSTDKSVHFVQQAAL